MSQYSACYPLAITIIMLALACSPASAASPPSATVGVHVATYHRNRDANFNEFNPGLYVMRDGWTAGGYRNSIRRVSVYAGYTFPRALGIPVDVTAGVVTGYLPAPVIPMLVPTVMLLNNMRLGVLLPFEKKGGGLHLSLEF